MCGSVYSASKHCLEGLTKNLALELQDSNIRVNSLAPGRVITRSFPEELGGINPATLRQPQDIAPCLVHLLSAEKQSGQFFHARVWDDEQAELPS
mmetsp:Transcript_35364/g.76480  ORF Transcript_35364/g.76480 Transcript_35364/m.76480 type:complete len:95 (-) Transcript_35364:37-321(-)